MDEAMSLFIRHAKPPEGLNTASAIRATFDSSGSSIQKIIGPGSLIRLVDGSRYNPNHISPAEYWMDEEVFRRALAAAHQDLKGQGHGARQDLLGLHARFQLRDGLAVSRDWSNLDRYIRLTLPAGASIYASVGRTRTQPYYSSSKPEDQARANAAGVSLPGLSQQIVINFQHEANKPARRFITGPHLF